MKNLVQKFFLSFIILLFSYFAFLYLDAYILHLSDIWIGFIREMITLPLIILQFPLFVISLIIWGGIDDFRIKTYSFWALVILLISMGLTLIPFLIE